jgi:hypothetical protein
MPDRTLDTRSGMADNSRQQHGNTIATGDAIMRLARIKDDR